MNKKFLITIPIVIIIATIFIITNNNKEKDIQNNKTDNKVVMPVAIEHKEKYNTTIYYINDIGQEIKESYSFESDNAYNDLFLAILDRYKMNKNVKFSDNIQIINTNTIMNTLIIDFNQSLENCVFSDKNTQEKVINGIGKSFRALNKDEFDDIQFRVNKENKDYLFGSNYNTLNPIRIEREE